MNNLFSDGSTMGLSTISVLQQKGFVNSVNRQHYMRRVANKVIFFHQTVKLPRRRQITEKQLLNLQKDKLTGMLSRETQKKMVSVIQNWDDTIQEYNATNHLRKNKSKRQIIMLTLTLSKKQWHDDRVVKRQMLVPFIQKLVRIRPSLNYLWKAEPQQNGNIHFHLLIDHYFDKDYIRMLWNELQSRHGYHDLINFKKGNEGQPSTRIEGLRDKVNAVSYCAKYVSKNEGDRAILGRLWGCSDRLKLLKNIEYKLSNSETTEIFEMLRPEKIDVYVDEFCAVIDKPVNWNLVKDSLSANYSANIAIMYNLDLLTREKLHSSWNVTETEWYQDISREVGEINGSYLLMNELLFDNDTLGW